MVSGLGSCVFCFGLVVRSGRCLLRCEEKWLAVHLAMCIVLDVFDFFPHAMYERGFVFFGSTGCAPDQHRAGGRGSREDKRGRHLGGRGRCSRHLIFRSSRTYYG